MAALVLLANFYSPISWALLVLFVALLSFREFVSMCKKMQIFPAKNLVYFFIVVFVMGPLFFREQYSANFVYVVQLSLIVSSYVLIFSSIILKQGFKDDHRFVDVSSSLWALFHLGLLPSFLTWIRLMESGFEFTLMILVSVALNDTFAMVFGKLFGRFQLAPVLSPRKTIVGSIGGLIFGTLSFAVIARYFDIGINQAFWAPILTKLGNFDYEFFVVSILALLGFLLSVLAQIGDLLVSALKRAAGVKDTGNLLMSHGGVLDRIDSHIFVTWFAFFVFAYLLS